MNPAVLETFQKYRSALWPVNCLIPQDFHKNRRGSRLVGRAPNPTCARRKTCDERLLFPQQNAPSSRSSARNPVGQECPTHTATSRDGRYSIKKRSFGGLCENQRTR